MSEDQVKWNKAGEGWYDRNMEAFGKKFGLSALGVPSSGSHTEIANAIGRLVDEKQIAYGDSFGKSGSVMAILYPNGISVDQYQDALAVVRVIDKLFRIATMRDAFGESPWNDIAGYAILAVKKAQDCEKQSG